MTDVAVSTVEHDRLLASADALRREVARRIVGQVEVVDQVLLALLAGGHALLVGVPGLAKTLLVRSIAEATDLLCRRIQFTPDLVPSDVTGTEVMEEGHDARRTFRFVEGPIFTNILLADEINRTPPRTQAALLEGMQEQAVTTAGVSRALPRPFFVLATQNPIEQEGTYPLPEAQLDRFLLEIHLSYPSEWDEIDILRRTTSLDRVDLERVLSRENLLALQRLVRSVEVSESVLVYAAAVVRATRPKTGQAPDFVNRHIRWGAGPRAGQALVLCAKAHAILDGRLAVSATDITRVAIPVLRHRLVLNFAAEAEGITREQILESVFNTIALPARLALPLRSAR